ncbi:hypothetical protein J7K28_01290 [Candidatus Aerophobetes bacterium]|nr:hypothetical protein [Candidatus Aerophobetes bacterium]
MSLSIKTEMPGLKTPVCLILDDSSPGEKNYLEFVEEFSKLVSETKIKGKFTLMPYPSPVALDEALAGKQLPVLQKTVSLIRENIAPYFDISPEILTHNQIVDLKTGLYHYPCISEEEWSQTQNKEALTAYIAYGLNILKNVGLEANGVTSPSHFGSEVEDSYARAVLEAEKKINNISLTWYFLHVDKDSPVINPKVSYLNKTKKEAVVSIISGYGDYIKDEEEEEFAKYTDQYISEDGEKGRLATLYQCGSCLVFHHHWWRMIREEKLEFKILYEVTRRLRNVYGDKIRWMKVSEISRYFATQNSFEVNIRENGETQSLEFKSPFICPEFTISLTAEENNKNISITKDGELLNELNKGETLKKDSWFLKNKRIYLCFDLSYENTIRVQRKK